jgi:MFS family permease
MLVALLAPACSPAIGGLLVQTLSWRWIFFATLPVAIVTFVLACLWLKHEMPAMKAARLLNLSLLADPLLRFSMLVYLRTRHVYWGERHGHVLSSDVANMSPAQRDAHAAVVCGIVYRHHGNGTLF